MEKQETRCHCSLKCKAKFKYKAFWPCEALWLKILLQDLQYPLRQPIWLYYNNKTICDIAYNLIQHDHMKHDRWIFINKKLNKKKV
jgi:hypothetical protein